MSMYFRKICFFAILLFITRVSPAQTSRADLYFSPGKAPAWHSEVQAIPLSQPEPFIAVSLAWKGESRSFEARFSNDGRRWSDWVQLHLDPHGEQSPEHYVSELYFAEASSRYVQFRANGPAEHLRAHFYDPGPTKERSENYDEPVSFRGPDYCPCPQPDYQDREDWCPDGSCPPDPTPDYTNATHLIVHHSAGPNTATDWAAVVRSFWDYHTINNGWDDIGYNWLIDPDGVIYEGRGDGVLGAHFCCKNGGTMGVCVIGDFTNITPTEEALNALRDLLAWKACDADIDPLGKAFHPSSGLVLDNISGHRDGYDPNASSSCRICGTECPGDAFYPLLGQVRSSVADHIANSCAPIGFPRELRASAVSETEALLEWEDNTDNETAFLIERSLTFNGGYAEIASVGENITSYNDTGLDPQTGYYYRIRSANEQDTSIYSNKAFVFMNVVGLDGPLGAAHVRLFPNPVKNRLAVTLDSELTGQVRLRLLDATGRETWNGEMQGGHWTVEVPMAQLPEGLYFLQLNHKEATAAYKVVRE